ncbi:hypothetical protein [Evansella clarkii]|uniref:hypothetical protein n=1 Tax=Evansella clarkii TaxID=79879 RepID=UPI0009984CE2|nr:hypothetical protein [Evansella clarkii]
MNQIDRRLVQQHIDDLYKGAEQERLARQFKDKQKRNRLSTFRFVIKLRSVVEFRFTIYIRTWPRVRSDTYTLLK